MRRRKLLAMGVAGGALLAVLGSAVVLQRPVWRDGRLLDGARLICTAIAAAVLDGSLPEAADRRRDALAGHLVRLEAVLAGLPPHAQREVDQLLAVLDSAPGRMALTGMASEWSKASRGEVQDALARMRTSSLLMRRQAYSALRDLTHGAWFADPSTWLALGYPGPKALS